MLLAAARRFFTLLAGIAVVTAAGSLLLGLGLGARANRSVAVGFYLVGCVLLLGAFFAGNRGRFGSRTRREWWGCAGRRGVRVASGDEQAESYNLSGLLVLTGVALIALGAAVDSNAELI